MSLVVVELTNQEQSDVVCGSSIAAVTDNTIVKLIRTTW